MKRCRDYDRVHVWCALLALGGTGTKEMVRWRAGRALLHCRSRLETAFLMADRATNLNDFNDDFRACKTLDVIFASTACADCERQPFTSKTQ